VRDASPQSVRYPEYVWNRMASLLVVGLVVTPPLFAMLLAPSLRTPGGLATATEFVIFPTVLIAAILLYVQFRLTGSNVIAWGTLCFTFYAVQGVMLAGLRAGNPGPFFERPGWILIVDLPVSVVVLLGLRRASHMYLPIDPLGAGLLAGVLVAGVNLLLNNTAPKLPMDSPVVLVVDVFIVAIGAAIGHTVYRLDGFPRWFSLRIGVAVLALVVNRLAICQEDHVVFDWIAIATGVVGAVLMVTASGAGVRFALHEQGNSLVALSDQVALMEADERDTRARLHEITNSISSIAVASSLLHQAGEVSAAKREKLEQMIEAEAGRLARTLTNAVDVLDVANAEGGEAAGSAAGTVIDLDEVIEPLVVSHQALLRRVEWEPSGCVAVGNRDAVAEAVNILLDNSARHAPEANTRIEVNQLGDTVEIAVRDDGPGVPMEVRRRLFEWGGRGPNSKGQGIGLHLAHQLMSSAGNSLRLEADRSGTSFVIGLPAVDKEAS
jgi:signal transduction histidine kinase